MNEENDFGLDRIPPPPPQSDSPDEQTREEIDDNITDFDAREQLVIRTILVVVIALGALNVLFAAGVQLARPQNSGLEILHSVLFSLGVELTAGGGMVAYFFYIYRKVGNDGEKFAHLTTLCIVGVVATAHQLILPACLSCSFLSAVGVEAIGSIVLFAVLDNVIDAINEAHQTGNH